MGFEPTAEQRAFTDSVRRSLSAADIPSVTRAWSDGDHAPGRAMWQRLAATGLFALAVPEECGGDGPAAVELALALAESGRAAAPGPLVETCAVAAGCGALKESAGLLGGIAEGGRIVSARPEHSAYALDGDVAEVLVLDPGTGSLLLQAPCTEGESKSSADPARRLFLPPGGGEVLARGEEAARAFAEVSRWAMLLTAAQSLGLGLALLEQTVEHVKQRRQFGVPVGSFQAVKHRLADTLLALEFARPLVFGAAVTGGRGDAAAAKTAAGEAAYAAARTALQLHGAVGYTEELDLALWLRKARPLRDAWGTPKVCRALVLED